MFIPFVVLLLTPRQLEDATIRDKINRGTMLFTKATATCHIEHALNSSLPD
jgi:hypothetical protein